MKARLRYFIWSFGTFLVLLLLVAGGTALWLRSSLPTTQGSISVAGLSAPVSVLRSPEGVVTIRAEGELDAYRALGYVHAQDRLWQMEYMRRTGAGRLSEILGAATLDIDRFLRTLGLYRVAEANLRHVSEPVRELLAAYAEGVNAFIAEPGGALPLEFQLLGATPEPWQPADSLVWGRLMAFLLSNNWADELRRARLASRLTAAQLRTLWPAYPGNGPVTGEEHAAARPPAPKLPTGPGLPAALQPRDASNAWALDGTRTRSGKPILANDPHLELESPGIWYLVRLETPGLTLAGVTTPGVPFLVLGHNGHIAWGLTTTHSDTQDFFIERQAADDPRRYLSPQGPLPFETREEVIDVKGDDPLKITIRESRHGPILDEVLGGYLPALRDDERLALAWPALRADDRTAEAFYLMNRATDWDSFNEALGHFHAPQQNILYADIEGNIGFVAPARVPLRAAGDGGQPVPGWTGEFEWQGFIPFAELPRAFNPPNGRIVSANNKIVPDDYPYLIAVDWPSPQRAHRITQLLDEAVQTSLEDSLALQLDTLSLGAGELLPLLLEVPPRSRRGRQAAEALAAWDLRMVRDRPEPLIFYAWVTALNQLLTADELGPDSGEFQRPDTVLLTSILSEHPDWCDDRSTAAREDCPTQVLAALELALDILTARFGEDMTIWHWGVAHRARFPHPVLSRIPVIGDAFSYDVATDGGEDTINRGGLRFGGTAETRFEHIHGAGLRAVYDLSNLDNSRFMIATGQSGNPLSPLYGNLAEAWRDGRTLKLVVDEQAPLRRLTLVPPS